MTNIEIFRVFLKKHRKYSAYKNYVKHRDREEFPGYSITPEVLVASFSWVDTAEGPRFWSKLSRSWCHLSKDFNLKRDQINVDEV